MQIGYRPSWKSREDPHLFDDRFLVIRGIFSEIGNFMMHMLRDTNLDIHLVLFFAILVLEALFFHTLAGTNVIIINILAPAMRLVRTRQ